MAGVLRYITQSPSWRLRPRLLVVTAMLACAAVLGACAEDLDGGSTCATLCPGTDLPSREVTLFPVTQEDVVRAYIENGGEFILALMDRKDTVQTRAVVRFDTLVTQYQDSVTDSLKTIDTLSSAAVVLALDIEASTIQDSLFIDAYDVDDGSDDTTAAGIEAKLVESRRLGSRRVAKEDIEPLLGDTLHVPIDVSRLLAIMQRTDEAQRRLRVAFKLSSPRSAVLRVVATAGSNRGPVLRYKHPKSSTFTGVVARSDGPTSDLTAKAQLADFLTIPVQAPRLNGAVLAVGGLPSRRTLMRFAVPDSIDDAAAIIQAELRLVQVPDPLKTLIDSVETDTTNSTREERRDTVIVLPLIGVGGDVVFTDPLRAAQLARRTVGVDNFAVPALRTLPSDSGVKSIDVAGLLRRWKTQASGDPRYLVFAAESEGAQAATAYFWSSLASDPSLRPTLHIRYIPRVGYGIP